MSEEYPIGPNPCPVCGGEYGEHDVNRCRRGKSMGMQVFTGRDIDKAHRAGAREACAKLSDWAFGAMEGEDLEAFTAYENCHVSAENLKARYAEPEEEKKG